MREQWHLAKVPGEGMNYFQVRTLNNILVCSLPASATKEPEKNGNLIAAAPDMLEALEIAEATINRLHRHAPGSANGTLDVIKAAIQKAEAQS